MILLAQVLSFIFTITFCAGICYYNSRTLTLLVGERMGIRLVPYEIEGETGLDVIVDDQNASVADLIAALQLPADDPSILKPYHKRRYSVCHGCVNNCCKYNSIVVDLVAAERLAEHFGLNFSRFAQVYLSCEPDLPFPEFKQRPCPFLVQNCCTVYAARALICRLYLCTPMTERLEKLRCGVLFAGEAALRQRLVELGLAPSSWHKKHLMAALDLRRRIGAITQEAWVQEHEQLDLLLHRNPFLIGSDYETVRLKECCTPELWQFVNNNEEYHLL